jgi:hypothetical protein
MRKLIFALLLLCCSTQVMAADPCASLQGKKLTIDANGFHGVIGPSGINLVNQNNTFTFQTTANFTNEPADPVKGECTGRHLTFTRTRTGAKAFVQEYDGWIFEIQSSHMAGTFSHNGSAKNFGWCAESSKGAEFSTQSCLAQCGEEQKACIADASPGQKPACIKEYQACKRVSQKS